MKHFDLLTTEEKIKRCEEIRDTYPEYHKQREEIQKQIERLKQG